MNEWLCRPLAWDDNRKLDRGKVMTYADLEAGREFGRYLDVDGDGIAYRTYPATHPTKGGFFTRGTSRNPYARYSEEGSVYVDNMQRLLRKFATAKALIPAPERRDAAKPTATGVIYFGSTTPAMHEALEVLQARDVHLDALRVRGFPFCDGVIQFIADHDRVFVVEQNRDGQLRSLLTLETGVPLDRLESVRYYGGFPMSAHHVITGVKAKIEKAA
jgi:2-oxoglutarate ferredoxin oxidoreductase subunit alpha